LNRSLSPAHLALILAVTAVWGFTFVPIKVALVEVPPFMLAAARFLLAAVPAVFFVRRPDMPWRGLFAYGFVIGVVQFGLMFLGMHLGMPAGLSSLVMQTQVFFTIGLAIAFTGDRLQRRDALGAIVAAAGAAIVSVALYLIFKNSTRLVAWLGEVGMLVLMRLMAFILLCIGIQIMWNGWAELNAIAQ